LAGGGGCWGGEGVGGWQVEWWCGTEGGSGGGVWGWGEGWIVCGVGWVGGGGG